MKKQKESKTKEEAVYHACFHEVAAKMQAAINENGGQKDTTFLIAVMAEGGDPILMVADNFDTLGGWVVASTIKRKEFTLPFAIFSHFLQ